MRRRGLWNASPIERPGIRYERVGRGIRLRAEFRREIEEPIAGAIAVPRSVPLVVTEGNYLLFGDGDWARVRPLLDEAWCVSRWTSTPVSSG